MDLYAYCRACKREIRRGSPTCRYCGADQLERRRSRSVAALLAVLLGSFGAHRFYLGQWWGALHAIALVAAAPVASVLGSDTVLRLLVCAPGVVGLLEGVAFLRRDQTDWDVEYNQSIPTETSRAALTAAAVFAGLGALALAALLVLTLLMPLVGSSRGAEHEAAMKRELARAASAQEARRERGQAYKSCVECTSSDLPGFKPSAGIAVDAAVSGDGFILQAQHEACPSARWVYESRVGGVIAAPPCR